MLKNATWYRTRASRNAFQMTTAKLSYNLRTSMSVVAKVQKVSESTYTVFYCIVKESGSIQKPLYRNDLFATHRYELHSLPYVWCSR